MFKEIKDDCKKYIDEFEKKIEHEELDEFVKL